MKPVFSYAQAVEAEITDFLSQNHFADNSTIQWGSEFITRLQPFATSGKLLRGSLLCYSYHLFTSERTVPPSVIRTAATLEILHSALLIHDDVMDQDAIRRGQASHHMQYRELAVQEQLAEPTHFGNSMAVCGGDMALLLAFDLLSRAALEPQLQAKILRMYSSTLLAVCAGQMQDLYLGASSKVPSRREIYDLMKTKTAIYTITLPLIVGATLTHQSAATLRKLRILGEATGTIFQIRDDELGVMGGTAELGKPIGSDIASGKKTIVAHYLLKQARGAGRERIRKLFGSGHVTADDIAFIRNCMEQYDITRTLSEEVAVLEQKAIAAIASLTITSEQKVELESLVSFCARRRV